jgi:hypothetical protein
VSKAEASPELLHDVLDALGDKVGALVVEILVWLDAGDVRVERQLFRLVRERVLQFPEAAQQACSVCPDFRAFLAQAELDREPVELESKKKKKKRNSSMMLFIYLTNSLNKRSVSVVIS